MGESKTRVLNEGIYFSHLELDESKKGVEHERNSNR